VLRVLNIRPSDVPFFGIATPPKTFIARQSIQQALRPRQNLEVKEQELIMFETYEFDMINFPAENCLSDQHTHDVKRQTIMCFPDKPVPPLFLNIGTRKRSLSL
jgi:hypothetical protein